MVYKSKCLKNGFTSILWVTMAIILYTSPCGAQAQSTVFVGLDPIEYELDSPEIDIIYVVGGGTLKLMPRGYTSGLLWATSIDGETYGAIEIYGSHDWLYADKYIQIDDLATVTLFTDSTNSIELTDLDPRIGRAELDDTTIVVDGTNGWIGTLTWDYQGTTYSLNINTLSDIIVEVVGSSSPEQLIDDLIKDVKALNAKTGILNSLDAKLQNALDALEAANAGQRQDAVSKIQAFINAVEAQSGKAIEETDAAFLIDSAYLIISLL